MKKYILALALLSLAGCNSGFNLDLAKPDYAYEIDTFMENSEVYEFTPKSNTSMTCVMLMLDSGKAMGLQCFPKPPSKLNTATQ